MNSTSENTRLNALAEVDKLTVTDRTQLKDIAEQVQKLEELVKEHKQAIVYIKQQRKIIIQNYQKKISIMIYLTKFYYLN